MFEVYSWRYPYLMLGYDLEKVFDRLHAFGDW